jgi:hypothetical protein
VHSRIGQDCEAAIPYYEYQKKGEQVLRLGWFIFLFSTPCDGAWNEINYKAQMHHLPLSLSVDDNRQESDMTRRLAALVIIFVSITFESIQASLIHSSTLLVGQIIQVPLDTHLLIPALQKFYHILLPIPHK